MSLPGKMARVVGRRYHFNGGGLAYVLTTMVLVVGAVNSQNNMLFWLFGLGVAGLLISGFLSGGTLMQIGVEREVAPVGQVGDEVVIRYRLHNRSRVFPAYAITVEELARHRRTVVSWPGRLRMRPAFAAYIPPRGSVVVETRALACRRGIAEFGPVQVWSTFPFGLTRKSVTYVQEGRVAVRPWTAPVREGLLRARAGAGGNGQTVRRSRTGDEFYSLREFAHGDSLRSIAWRSTARLGHAVVREMASRPSRRVWVVLCFELDVGDGTVSSGGVNNEQVISVGAGLLAQAVRNGLEPGLALADGRVLEHPRASAKLDRMMDALATLNPVGGGGGGAGKGLAFAGPQDGVVLVCSAGAGPEGIAGERVLIEDSGNYSEGLPAGWHPRFEETDRKRTSRWWKLVEAWTGGDE